MNKEASLQDVLNIAKGMLPAFKTLGVQQLKAFTVPVLGLAIGAGLAGRMQKKRVEEHDRALQQDLLGSYKAILNYGKIDANPGLIRTRLEEIAQHSPTVASTPAVASKIIKRTLHTGLTDDDLEKLYAIEHNQHGIKHLRGLSFPESTSEKFVKEIAGPGIGSLAGQIGWMLAGDPLDPPQMSSMIGDNKAPVVLPGMQTPDIHNKTKQEIDAIMKKDVIVGHHISKINKQDLDATPGDDDDYVPNTSNQAISNRAMAAEKDGKTVPNYFKNMATDQKAQQELERRNLLAHSEPYHPDAVEHVQGLRELYPDYPGLLKLYPLLDPNYTSTEKKGHVMNQEPNLEFATRVLADQYCLIKSAAIAFHADKIKSIAQKSARNVLKKQKASGIQPSVGGVLKGLMGAAAIGLGVGAAHQVGSYFQTKKMNEKIKDSWAETSGTLKRLSEESSRVVSGVDYSDPETQAKARGAFQTLADVAPVLASNPMLATTFVNTVMQNEGQVGIDTAKTISEIQKNLKSVSEYESPFAGSPAIQGFESGFGMAGGKDFVKNIADVVGKGAEI